MISSGRYRWLGVSGLSILALILMGAGMSRLGLGIAVVLAGEEVTLETGPELHIADTQEDLGDLFQALRERARAHDAREAWLEERAEELRAAEAELARQLEMLAQAEAQLAATLQITETASEQDLQHLTTVFESMKPAQTAELFQQMDIEFAAGFIARLRPEIAGEVMSGLDPMIAYAISAVLAGRHARTPTR